jgi:hypothetical protein
VGWKVSFSKLKVKFMNLTAIIGRYKKCRAKHPDQHLLDAAKYANIADAIDHAAKARDRNGAKHPHQHRVKNPTLDQFAQNLQKRQKTIASSPDFDTLIAEVEKNKIPGIGDLTVYDTALRIGVYLGIPPTQVYLHQGTREGAENLLGKKFPRTKSLPVSCFPKALQKLSAAEIEDILCIEKKSFVQNSTTGKGSACIPASRSKSKC